MCESFKSWVLGPHHKAIISMNEEIRQKIMQKHVDMLKFVEKWTTDL